MLQSTETFIHRFMPGRSADAPTLLLLHGTGGSEDDLIDIGRMLHPDAAILSPRGRVLENGLSRFFRRVAEGVFDLDDLKMQSAALAAFIAAAAGEYRFNVKRVFAVGYSNGANIAGSLLLLHPGTLAGAVLFHAMVPIVPDELPDLRGVPVFMGAGRLDTMIRPEQSEELERLLSGAGAAVTAHWVEGGHSLTRDEVEAAAEWLKAASGGLEEAAGSEEEETS